MEHHQGKDCYELLVPPLGAGIFNLRDWRAGDIDGGTRGPASRRPKEIRPEEVSMFEAVERQPGLKLEPSRAVMPVLVIDSLDHPTEN